MFRSRSSDAVVAGWMVDAIAQVRKAVGGIGLHGVAYGVAVAQFH